MSRILANTFVAYRWAGLRYAARYFMRCAVGKNRTAR